MHSQLLHLVYGPYPSSDFSRLCTHSGHTVVLHVTVISIALMKWLFSYDLLYTLHAILFMTVLIIVRMFAIAQPPHYSTQDLPVLQHPVCCRYTGHL